MQAGLVLLGHRSPSRRWYPDVWDLPGGHVEPRESAAGALVRELREELGIVVSVRDLSPIAELRGPPEASPLRLRVSRVLSWTGVPVNQATDEHDEIAWFDKRSLPGLDLAHSAYYELLPTVLDEAGSGEWPKR